MPILRVKLFLGPGKGQCPAGSTDPEGCETPWTDTRDAACRSASSDKFFIRRRRRQSTHTRPRQVQKLALGDHTQTILSVNNRLALSNPAFLSTPSKKSFSRVNCLILACRTFKSASDGPEGLKAPSLAKSPARFSTACWRNWRFGWGEVQTIQQTLPPSCHALGPLGPLWLDTRAKKSFEVVSSNYFLAHSASMTNDLLSSIELSQKSSKALTLSARNEVSVPKVL